MFGPPAAAHCAKLVEHCAAASQKPAWSLSYLSQRVRSALFQPASSDLHGMSSHSGLPKLTKHASASVSTAVTGVSGSQLRRHDAEPHV